MNHRLGACLLIFIITCSAEPTRAIGPAPSWKPRQTVSTSAQGAFHDGSDRSLAYDHWGNPGIVFQASPLDDLMYARFISGVGWRAGVVDDINGGIHPSLAFDRHERPVISAVSFSGNPIRSYTLSDLTWNAAVVDGIGGNFLYSSLAIDSTGKPAVAYFNANMAGQLRYVKDTDVDGDWSDETIMIVDGANVEGYYASLVFDSLDQPMIAHQDRSNNDLRFSKLESGVGWTTTTVDSAGLAGYQGSLAIDPDTGYPAIAYFNDGTQDLRYAAWNGTSWVLMTVASTGDVGRYPSLAFDPADGNPAISYYDLTNGDLRLAWFNGSSWQTQPVDTAGNVGLYTSLAFNDYGTGFPSIAYFDTTGANLYFIEDPPATVPEPRAAAILVLVGLLGQVRRQRPVTGGAIR